MTKQKEEFEYEFGGPIGTALNVVLLPILVLVFCTFSHMGSLPKSYQDLLEVLNPKQYSTETIKLSFIIILVWFLLQVLLERILPCQVVQGTLLRDKKTRLSYNINGHSAFWVTISLLAAYTFQRGDVDFLAYVYDIYTELAIATITYSILLSIYLYFSSFIPNPNGTYKPLAEPGSSNIPIYDFFMGRELNPRIGTFDWKEFCELRPGLIGWLLLNLCMACKQYQIYRKVTGSMILTNLFQGFYVWDALYNEGAILTTMDITTDGFGFMLIFGDLAWVPFMYSIQARFLVLHDPHLSNFALGVVVFIHFIGYYIFRSANGQKNDFRSNPNAEHLKHLKFMPTKRGTKLLISGWWGMARKVNYTGDWIMGLSWCFLCGFESVVPYFYAVYFAILLIHRSERDDAACEKKYEEDWARYKDLVRYKFIPGLF